MNMNRWIMLSLMISLSGCGSEEFQDLQDFVNNSGADMRGKIEAPPEVKPYEPFAYNNSDGLPDPFNTRKPDKRAENSSPGVNQPKEHHHEELEDFALESLRMVGYLYIHDTAYAVISSPDGKLHHVKAGNYMGQNYGQIISVTETEVKLKEEVQDGTGPWTDRISTLQLTE